MASWTPILEAYGIDSADDMARTMARIRREMALSSEQPRRTLIQASGTWLWEKPADFEKQWTESAQENGLSFLKLPFEEIIKDKAKYIERIADFVGLEIKRPIEDIIADTTVERTIER